MNNLLDRLQKAWQSQSSKPLDVNPDQLLKAARLARRVYFCVDMFVIAVFLGCGGWMLRSAFRDIQKEWPWLIYSACLAWVIGYILFNRWRRRRHAARADEPLLSHVEWSIKELEHRMWQDRHTFWWYTLPIALGCMIPPAISFGMDFLRSHEWNVLFELLFTEGMFASVFYFVHWIIKNGKRLGLQTQRRELEALLALRETLLNTEEPHV